MPKYVIKWTHFKHFEEHLGIIDEYATEHRVNYRGWTSNKKEAKIFDSITAASRYAKNLGYLKYTIQKLDENWNEDKDEFIHNPGIRKVCLTK